MEYKNSFRVLALAISLVFSFFKLPFLVAEVLDIPLQFDVVLWFVVNGLHIVVWVVYFLEADELENKV